MGKNIVLHLAREVNGVKEKKKIKLKLTPVSAAKKITAIRKAMREGWHLEDCTGDNPKVVAFLKSQISSWEIDPKKYKVPIKETVRLGVELAPKPKKGEIRKKLSIRDIIKRGRKNEQRKKQNGVNKR